MIVYRQSFALSNNRADYFAAGVLVQGASDLDIDQNGAYGDPFANMYGAGVPLYNFGLNLFSGFLGHRIYIPASNGCRIDLCYTGPLGAATHLIISIGADGSMTASCAGTVLETAPPGTCPTQQWVWVDFGWVIDGVNGSLVVRVKQTPVLSITGAKTSAATGTATGVNLILWNQDGSNRTYVQHVIVCDTTGSEMNTYVPDLRVTGRLVTGPGSITGGFSPIGKSANWQAVQCPPVAGVFMETSSSGEQETFTVGNLPATAQSVVEVSVTLLANKDNSGVHTLSASLQSNGTLAQGPVTSLSDSPMAVIGAWPVDPGTNSVWTVDAANLIQPGARSVS